MDDDYSDDWEDEEEAEGLSMFAYQGFGPVCLRFECKHWGGDGLCDLAIAFTVADETGSEPLDDYCPLDGV